MITHLENFNLKDFVAGKNLDYNRINELQRAINDNNVIALKRIIRDSIERLEQTNGDDLSERIEKLGEISGRDTGVLDWFFFNSRERCPEMTEPECSHCSIDALCAHRKELFQPVMRTTDY